MPPINSGARYSVSVEVICRKAWDKNMTQQAQSGPNIGAAVEAIEGVVFEWRRQGDTIIWSDNAMALLQTDDPASIATGTAFEALCESDTGRRRHAVIDADNRTDRGDGVPYAAEYGFFPRGPDGPYLWIEEIGRWYADCNRGPDRVSGMLRVVSQTRGATSAGIRPQRYDALTGQLDRAALLDDLSKTIDAAKHDRSEAAFLAIGIDNLVVINEIYGFDVADDIIARIGRRLRKCMRGADTIGHLSGNKFGLILNTCDTAEVQVAAKRFVAAVSNRVFNTGRGQVPASICIGAVALPRHGRTAFEALAHAHMALDEAKKSGLGIAQFYKPVQHTTNHARIGCIGDLVVDALNDRRVDIALHPVVDARNGSVVCRECLVRISDADGKVMPASEVLPVAERLSLIRLIDHRVFELALDRARVDPGLRLAVNVSAQTAADPEWISRIASALAGRPRLAEQFVFEITETTVIHNIESMTRFVSTIKELGAQVAIDDFGTGYTSFQNLKVLDIDIVKIDGAFIRGMSECQADRAFVRALVDLAQALGIKTVAEYVGDKHTAEDLLSIGVDYLQGDLFGAPMETEQPAPDAAPVSLPAG